MILRTITRHVREQNWFAITIDFFIVVLGVGMALAARDWINERAQKADLAVARLTIDKDVTTLYFNALERLAVKECRITQIQTISKKLQDKQSQIKALLLDTPLTPSDRLRYFDVLAEIDAASSLLDVGLLTTLRTLETTVLHIAPATLSEFYDNLRVTNAIGPKNYGNCFVPITLPNVDLTPFAMVTNS